MERDKRSGLAGIRKPFGVQLWVGIFMILVGAGLLIAGFVLPPRGEIHSSVLVAFGEILTFAGTIFGIDYQVKMKYRSLYSGKDGL